MSQSLTARFAVAGFALFLLASPAAAQAGLPITDGSHAISLGFGGGVVVPTGDAKNALKNGVNGQAFVLVHLGPLPELRFNLGYQKFDFKQVLGINGLPGTGSGSTQILSGTGGLSIDLLHGPVRPYITAGLGAFDVSSAFDAANSGNVSKVNFGIDGGAGLSIVLGRLTGFAEGRVQNVYTRNGGVINYKSIQSVPVTFGVLLGL